jgi:hypothetical protein
MKFKPLFLYAEQETGKDILGNPIKEFVQIEESEGLFSSWTSKEIALDVREITIHNRKILTPCSKELLEQAEKVKFEDKYHSINEIKGDDTSRWRIIVVNRYGSESL